MTKEQVYKLLEILDENDCLSSEWDWADVDYNMNRTGGLTEDSLWLVSEINKIFPNPEQSIH